MWTSNDCSLKKKKKEQELENQTDLEWDLGFYATGLALEET